MEETQAFEHTNNKAFRAWFGNWLRCIHASCSVNLTKIFNSQCGRLSTIEFGDFVQNIDCILLTTLADEELGGLMKPEDEVPSAENCKCHGTNDSYHVSPAHVAGDGTTWLTRLDS